MAKSKGQGASKKNALASYKSQNRYQKNRIRRLERAFKAQPNNKQIEELLKHPEKIQYRRKIPKSKYGWIDMKDEYYNPSASNTDFSGPGILACHYKMLAIARSTMTGIENDLKYNRKKSMESIKISEDFSEDLKNFKKSAKKHNKKKQNANK